MLSSVQRAKAALVEPLVAGAASKTAVTMDGALGPFRKGPRAQSTHPLNQLPASDNPSPQTGGG
jgi:hypothetical protein